VFDSTKPLIIQITRAGKNAKPRATKESVIKLLNDIFGFQPMIVKMIVKIKPESNNDQVGIFSKAEYHRKLVVSNNH
jgi:DNA-directed RNA polymerase subunit F